MPMKDTAEAVLAELGLQFQNLWAELQSIHQAGGPVTPREHEVNQLLLANMNERLNWLAAARINEKPQTP
jgi:hypothetical protein